MIITFNHKEHTEMINRWCQGWGMQTFREGWLPPTGLIYQDNDNNMIIGAFLYMTDCKVAIIENVIANPESTHQDRLQGLGEIGLGLEGIARESGYRYLLGSTSLRSVARVSSEKGWSITEFNNAMMAKIIGIT